MSSNNLQLSIFKKGGILAISIFVISLLAMACKKDDIEEIPETVDEEIVEEEEDLGCEGVYDAIITNIEGGTFESGPYLAAYPGSWWTFSNADHLTCELAETDIIELTDRNFETCEAYYTYTTVTIPQILGRYTHNSGDGYIYGDSVLYELAGETLIAKQIDTEVGSEWYEFIDDTHCNENPWYTYYPIREVIAHHDSIELPNGNWFYDVLQIGQAHHYEGKGGKWSEGYYHYYYAKEIGLISAQNMTNLSDIRYLEDYYIAPH
jgi:hypothetical protein